jgi:hypothetical protein
MTSSPTAHFEQFATLLEQTLDGVSEDRRGLMQQVLCPAKFSFCVD